MALHPNQFHVNEAWIVFKLNDTPILTEADGDFNAITLMDSASCLILHSELILSDSAELSQLESKRFLKAGWSHKSQYPQKLFIPNHQPADILISEAKKHGISVIRVDEEALLVFIAEAREGFQQHISQSRLQ